MSFSFKIPPLSAARGGIRAVPPPAFPACEVDGCDCGQEVTFEHQGVAIGKVCAFHLAELRRAVTWQIEHDVTNPGPPVVSIRYTPGRRLAPTRTEWRQAKAAAAALLHQITNERTSNA